MKIGDNFYNFLVNKKRRENNMKKSVNLLAGQKKFLKILIKLQRISIFFISLLLVYGSIVKSSIEKSF